MKRQTRMILMNMRGGSDSTDRRYDPPEQRFRDRRGRERYDDGRFAPRGRAEYDAYGYGEYRDDSYDTRMGGYEPQMHHGMREKQKKMQGHIGFAAEEGMDWQTAKRWVDSMKNADGSKGAKWAPDHIESIMQKMGIECDPAECWAVTNSLYSDFCEVFRCYGIESPEFYVALAKAWLDDDDAVDEKAIKYFEHIVK